MSNSPHKKFQNISHEDCFWTSGFWAKKFYDCEHKMLPYMGSLLCGDVGHALNNFKIVSKKKTGGHKGMYWHDGDFYKWIEACTYVYAQSRNQELLAQIEYCISEISEAQEEDGYLQTQIQLRPDVGRYENRKYHEMYNTGHLLISACVHFRVTQKPSFLEIAIKHADLLYEVFFPENDRYTRFGFNQTQILGLVELYRCTSDQKYLELAQRFIDRRGRSQVNHDSTTVGYPIGDMVQERIPIREASEAAGHAVLALYFYSGAADVYAETGENALAVALDRLWESVTQKKMYVTGAVGQTHYGASSNRDKIEEGFIDDFMMPNLTAYNETCANLCNAMFSYRMLGIHGESKFADVMELVMFNSGLSGIGLDGKSYFYANPLRMIKGARTYDNHENATETPNREEYLECFCCPPNLVRTIAKLSSWAYSKDCNGLAVNLYGANDLTTTLLDGSELELSQETNYPWGEGIKISLNKCKCESFTISLRIPDWAKGATVKVNNEDVPQDQIKAGTYCKLIRKWQKNDQIDINFPMEIQLVEGNSRIEEVRNQVAVRRGPIVYCIESSDLPEGTKITDVYLAVDDKRTSEYLKDFLGGVVAIQTNVYLRENYEDGMYNTLTKPNWKKQKTRMIPYYAWSNRGTAEMTVFLPVIWDRPILDQKNQAL